MAGDAAAARAPNCPVRIAPDPKGKRIEIPGSPQCPIGIRSVKVRSIKVHRTVTAISMWHLVACDADAHGALVVITGPTPGIVRSVEIIDCPTEMVRVNGTDRVRIDAESAAEIVRLLDLPRGTVVHLEEGGATANLSAQSAFVQGSHFGQWKGILIGAGLTVRTVKPQKWKWALGLARRGASSDKNKSRSMARTLFPTAKDMLKRQKDHGRAEALLIAAHGHSFSHEATNDELAVRVRDEARKRHEASADLK